VATRAQSSLHTVDALRAENQTLFLCTDEPVRGSDGIQLSSITSGLEAVRAACGGVLVDKTEMDTVTTLLQARYPRADTSTDCLTIVHVG
jgi:hypothetical protein